jgi:hypothetical protein
VVFPSQNVFRGDARDLGQRVVGEKRLVGRNQHVREGAGLSTFTISLDAEQNRAGLSNFAKHSPINDHLQNATRTEMKLHCFRDSPTS